MNVVRELLPACGECGKVYRMEIVAETCCKPQTCDEPGCKEPRERPFVCCRGHRTLREAQRWEERLKEAVEHTGDGPVYSEVTERFYYDLDDALDDVANDDDEIRTLADLRLVICKPDNGRPFDLMDLISDSLPDDGSCYEIDEEGRKLEEAVNAWLESRGPFSWEPTRTPVKLPEQS